MNRTVTYSVDLLGGLWWPIGAPASMAYTVNADELDLPDGYDTDDELDAVDNWLATHSGDFSELIAARVERVVRATRNETLGSGAHRQTTTTLCQVLREFTDDEESMWADTFNDES